MIKKCCENCEYKNQERYICEHLLLFLEFEKKVRQDEKNKILDLLKKDLEDYKELREEYKDCYDLQIEDTALIVYINDLINTIENCY